MNSWPAPFDPTDHKDYYAEWGNTLGDDTIISATVALTAEAIIAGLKIDTTDYPPAVVDDGKTVEVWFEVEAADREDLVFDGEGTTLGVIFTILTAGGRRLQQTWALTVKQR